MELLGDAYFKLDELEKEWRKDHERDAYIAYNCALRNAYPENVRLIDENVDWQTKIGKDSQLIEDLWLKVERLEEAAKGRGMVSEMADMKEVAVLVCGLHDKVARLERELALREEDAMHNEERDA